MAGMPDFANKMKTIKDTAYIWMTVGAVMLSSCRKFLDIELPADKFAAEQAYQNDSSAGAVLSGILSSAASSPIYGSPNTYDALGFTSSLYTDDLTQIQTNPLALGNSTISLYYTNTLSSANGIQWTLLYRQIYACNLAIENIEKYKNRLASYDQWMGEALFLRAFSYFELINLYGNVPLALASDYNLNAKLPRSPKSEVYQQLIADLRQAEALLGNSYLDGRGNVSLNRVRPNRPAASALLARVYLYTGNDQQAEIQAAKVIGNTAQYQLDALNSVFLANSKETIWALAPQAPAAVRDYSLYDNGAPSIAANQSALALLLPAAMSQGLANSFETGDGRFDSWVTLRTTASSPLNGKFYFPAKYRSRTNGTEFNIILRLGEQYLIRAEARARQHNIAGAVADLNLLRSRARNRAIPGALPDYPVSMDQQACLSAILKERRVELFSEQAHRFYDLKRFGLIDAIMASYAPGKGGTWESYKQLWPIPANDLEFNPNLSQTPGYR